jgi:hypothetical protein
MYGTVRLNEGDIYDTFQFETVSFVTGGTQELQCRHK